MNVVPATPARRSIVLASGSVLVLLAVLLIGRFLGADNPTKDSTGAGSDDLTGGGRDSVSISDQSFTISGHMAGRLSPGVTRPLDLSLRNLTPFDLSVTRVTVRLRGVKAPHADATHRCTVADFAVRQLTVSHPITLPAKRATHLAALNLPRDRSPRVHMRNTSKNQDGCKGATLRLAYDGVAKRIAS